MTIESILSTNLEFTGKPAFKIVNKEVYSDVPLSEIKSFLVLSHYSYGHNGFEWTEYHRTNEAANLVINASNRKKSIRKKRTDEDANLWTEYHRTVEAANQLARAVNELIDPLYKENRDIEEEYHSLKSGNNSEKARPTINLTIEKLIDKSLELGSLVGLFEILSKNKQLDKTEVVQAIVSRITPEQLEQLTDRQIEKWSKSVDTYLGLCGTEVGKFKRDIEGKRASNKTNNQQKTLQILLQNQNKTTIDDKDLEDFKTLMSFLTRQEVVECLLKPNLHKPDLDKREQERSDEEICELNALLPKEDRLKKSKTHTKEEKKQIIEKALDFLDLKEEYRQSPTPQAGQETKPSTSCFGCCAQPTVRNEEFVVCRE